MLHFDIFNTGSCPCDVKVQSSQYLQIVIIINPHVYETFLSEHLEFYEAQVRFLVYSKKVDMN